jgi:hypothetical protein
MGKIESTGALQGSSSTPDVLSAPVIPQTAHVAAASSSAASTQAVGQAIYPQISVDPASGRMIVETRGVDGAVDQFPTAQALQQYALQKILTEQTAQQSVETAAQESAAAVQAASPDQNVGLAAAVGDAGTASGSGTQGNGNVSFIA